MYKVLKDLTGEGEEGYRAQVTDTMRVFDLGNGNDCSSLPFRWYAAGG